MNLASNCRYPLWFSLLCKMGMTELIFVVPGMKVNGQHYHDVLLALEMLPAIKHVASDTFVHLIVQLQQETPDFIGPDLWPPNSPDLNQADYKVWGVMQQSVWMS